MSTSLETQIDDCKILIKRIEIDRAKAEEQILMILRDINQDKRRLEWAKQKEQVAPETLELLQYTITRSYIEIEKYEVDARHHTRRLEIANENLKDLLTSVKRVTFAE